MKYKTIVLERKNGLGVLVLNRPDELNAVTHEMRLRPDYLF